MNQYLLLFLHGRPSLRAGFLHPQVLEFSLAFLGLS
jgi:hypothetical protein